MYKLKYTKEKIRGWLSTYRLNSRGALAKLKEDLKMFDEAIDKDDPVKVKYEFLDHFRKRFDKPPENRARIDICFPNVLSNGQRDDLERMVMKEEVKKAVWDRGSDKSPGPDGFSFSFFRHFWSTIEKDIFEAVDCLFTNEGMPNGCNSNFIALIPKIIDANMVKDFR
nr:RNA-directed DNA polymerase, eukaryota, reverse transcriptase zinc-binding domain protein [Tanacetum cinerariifolium]